MFIIFVNMETLKIDVLNPKAMQLLKDLEELDLITIHHPTKSDFQELLNELRSQEDSAPSLEEITAEVEKVRSERYAK
jgi:hypothetical protein